MSLVMGVSDHIVALNFGAQDRRRHARPRSRPHPDVIEAYLGHAGRCLNCSRCAALTASYGATQVLRRHRLRPRGRSHHRHPGCQRRRQDDHAARDLPDRGAPPAASCSTASSWSAGRPRTWCGWAWPTCPTAAAPSARCRSRRTCAWAPMCATTRPASRPTSTRMYERFPAPARTPPPAGRHPVGRRAADAGHQPRADAAPQAAAAGRTVVRPGAADRDRDLPHPARHQRRTTVSASCWSSRTPAWRSTSPTTPTCWRPAASRCRARSDEIARDEAVRRAYLGY